MIFTYFMMLGIIMFAIGISGIAASKNFLIMILSVEVALMASTIVAMSFFYFANSSNILLLIISIWSIAIGEVMVLVAFYKYMVKNEISMDVSKLSKLKN